MFFKILKNTWRYSVDSNGSDGKPWANQSTLNLIENTLFSFHRILSLSSATAPIRSPPLSAKRPNSKQHQIKIIKKFKTY